MTDLLGKPIPDFHESHTCKDCGAVITIPYVKPADPGGLPCDVCLSFGHHACDECRACQERRRRALTPEATAPRCTCGPDETDGHALGCPMLGGPEATAPDPLSPQWEACKTCGGDHWTKDHDWAVRE
jgi:hypothetical protein